MKEQTFQKTELIAVETKRLSDKYGKAFLNTKDIIYFAVAMLLCAIEIY